MKKFFKNNMLIILLVSFGCQLLLTVVMPGMMDWRHSVLCAGIIFLLFTIEVLVCLINIMMLLVKASIKVEVEKNKIEKQHKTEADKSVKTKAKKLDDEMLKANAAKYDWKIIPPDKIKKKEQEVIPEVFEKPTDEEIKRISK